MSLSSRSYVGAEQNFTVPGLTLATVGGAGLSGGALNAPVSAVPANRVKPCCGLPFTYVESPPTNSCLPSVANTCGPSGMPFGSAYQGPSRPSLVFWTRRWYFPPGGTSGKPPGTLLQLWACEPLYSQLPMTSTD